MATVQNNNIEFVIGDKAKISAADAYRLWFDTTHKQMILKGVEFIPKKLSELTNDSGFISSITKAMVEGVLTGTISSHTHAFSSLTSKPTTLSGYGITDGVTTSTLNSSLSKYLKLSGGTMTGILYADSAIIARGRGSNKGYQGYFNNSNYALIGNSSHIFNGSGKAQGEGALSFGQNSFAGIKNQDSDKDTYPYLALQPMNTQPIEVTTTTSSLGGGTFYGYPLLGGEVVKYSTPDGGLFTYENTSNYTQILLLVKNSDDKKLIFAGTPDHANLRDICYILFSNGYPSYLSEYITQVTERTVGDTTYYEVILGTYRTSPFPARYDFKTQFQFYCVTKVNNTNLSGASSYRSGFQAMAFNYHSYAIGGYSIALGMNSWATNFVSFASGYMSKAVNHYSIAMGAISLASGENSITLGYNSVAAGSASISMGASSLASGKNSITFGRESRASRNSAMAFGLKSIAEADNAITFGANSHAKNPYTTVFAFYGTSFQDYQTVFGKYNAEETGALLIGGGTSNTNRKNIFKVDWSGNVTGKSFSGYSNSVGGEGFKIYPENSNEINFGGTGSSPIIVFGASSKDSRAVPTTYKFGANGDSVLMGGVFTGMSKSATMLDTERTLTIGNTGKTFDGTADVSWSLDEIGVKDENVKFTTSVDNVDYRLTAIGQRIAGNVEGVNNVVTADGITMNPSTGNLKATSFTGSLIGNAATATKLKTPQNLWGNSFDGSGSVSGDLKFVADGLTSQVSHGMRIGSDYGGFIGFSQILGKDGVGVFTGISLGWGKDPETDAASVRINATTFTYKSYPILHSNNFSDYAPTKTGEGASGTWGISISGNADTATALTSSAGSSTQPIYFSNGKPVACSYTLAKSVPSNAVFTDTTYSVATATADGLMSSEMYNTKKVSSISVRQGATASEEIVRNHDIYVTYNEDNAENSLSHKVGGDVQIKIPNATTDYDGSMSYTDKRKLDSFNVDTSTNYYMGNVVRINGDYMLPPSATIADLRDYAPINGTIVDHIELQNGISSDKIPEMIRLSIHNITYMFSLNTIDYTNNQIVYVCPYVQVQFTIDSSTGQFEINSFNPI